MIGLSFFGVIVIIIWYIGNLPLISLLVPEFLRAWYMIPLGIFIIVYGIKPMIGVAAVVTALVTILLLVMNIITISI